jgi:hypothetical protein
MHLAAVRFRLLPRLSLGAGCRSASNCRVVSMKSPLVQVLLLTLRSQEMNVPADRQGLIFTCANAGLA